MAYSNDPMPNVYAHVPSPLPNLEFPKPYWINRLVNLIIVGCLDPDIAFAAMAVPAAANMFWTVITPSTKQLVQEYTGQSWICGARQTWSGFKQGQQIASSDSGRFIYGLVKGFDIAAYFAFFLSTGAKGVVDWITFSAKMSRICSGSQSPYRGLTPIGGWPVPSEDWGWGPQYLTAGGGTVGPLLTIHPNQVGAMIAWCSFSNLEGSGGVVVSMGIQDMDTGEIFDVDTVNNLFNTSNYSVVQYFTTEGRVMRETRIRLVVKCISSVTERMVPVNGGCYMRAWYPGTETAPPYYNMRQSIKSHPWKGPIG